jgi:DNA-binding SARP family transcriptional activator
MSIDNDTAWLTLRLLGKCEISCAHQPTHLETTKTTALLAYLALMPGSHERHKLAGLLWGNLPDEKAQRALRRALWNLRHVICDPSPNPVLSISTHHVTWNPHSDYWLDTQTLRQQITAGAYVEAVTLYQGDLLDALYVHDAPAYEEWLRVEREHFHTLMLIALHKLIQQKKAEHDYAAGYIYAQRMLELAPWREETHRELMQLLMLCGQRSAALVQYERCCRVLAEELGVQPAAETRQLYEQIVLGDASGSATPPTCEALDVLPV